MSNSPAAVVHDSYYVQQITIMFVFSVLAILAVFLRFWAMRIRRSSFELHDYLIVLALVFTLGTAALYIYDGFLSAANVPQGSEGQEKILVWVLKLQFISPLIWVASVTAIRTSIISLYIRLFPTRPFQVACHAVLAINLAFCLSTVLADCLICRPIWYRWDPSVQAGTCGRLDRLHMFIGVFNLLLDICVVAMPLPVLWGLKMSMSKKVALTGIFAMGIVICGCTLYRIWLTEKLSGGDTESSNPLIGILAALEALLGVINACLPLLRPIFRKMGRSAPKKDKSDDGNDVKRNNNITSGSIPIMLRVSHLWSKSLQLYTSSDEEPSSPNVYGDDSPMNAAKGTLHESRVKSITGTKGPEISVCRFIDEESALCEDYASLKEKTSGDVLVGELR